MIVAVPALGASLPKRIKLLLAITLTLVMMPSVVSVSDAVPAFSSHFDLAIALGREALVGLLIGTSIQMIVMGLQVSGEFMSATGGLQLGQSPDEQSGESLTAMSRMIGLLVIALLFAAGGHRMILQALMDSFQQLPPGDVRIADSMLTLVVGQLTAGIIAGIKVAAPVVAALLLTNVVTGLISRTLPQINVLAIGLSINTLALLVVTAVTVGSAGLIFHEELVSAAQRLTNLLAG